MNFLKKLLPMALVLIILIAMAVPALATPLEEVTFTEVNEVVYAITRVNVRKGPGKEYDVIVALNVGEAVQRTGIGNNGWSRVVYRGEVAYMYSSYISNQKPSNFGGATLDVTALREQMGLVNGLNPADYTAESWEQLKAVMAEALVVAESKNQTLVDETLEKLKGAVAGLVKMDLTDLERALLAVEDFSKADAYDGLWVQLTEAAKAGQEALDSGDQAAVDAAAQQIHSLLTQMRAMNEERLTPTVVEKEVPVEVLPTDDYCNIPGHRVWPIVAVISLAVNLCLLAVIGIYITKKKKTQRDDTPLVDYDIDDDTF